MKPILAFIMNSETSPDRATSVNLYYHGKLMFSRVCRNPKYARLVARVWRAIDHHHTAVTLSEEI